MPARFLFLDEVDAYPGDVEGEGDPVALAEARARTFGSGARPSGLDADDLRPVSASSGSTRPATSGGSSCPARIAAHAVAAVRAAALGQGRAGDRRLPLRGLRRRRSASTTRPRCWRRANGGPPPTPRDPHDDRLPHLGALLAGGLARLGADRCGMGGGAGETGRSRPSRTPCWARPGRRGRGAGLAAAGRSARGLRRRAPCRRGAAADRRRRRAERPDRGQRLGLGPGSAVLAGRAPRAGGQPLRGGGLGGAARACWARAGGTPPVIGSASPWRRSTAATA